GIDLARPMLDTCRKKINNLSDDVRERIELVHGDIREFSLDQKYNLAILPFRVFQHLIEVEDQLSCLACIRRHLNPGGLMILDLFNPSLPRLVDDRFLEEFGEEPEFEMPDGRRVIRKFKNNKRDCFRQVFEVELIYYVTHPDGTKERQVHAFPFRYFFRYELEHLLARTGFEVIDLYADYDKSKFGSKDPGELIFIARKYK
ncbi:MAG: methyltransferase domain-containing protein, partial [candidate division Zixibacteria bacterium]|nr:methyltransferase domain-containing protein [candidate division Zixibacteria bacterium]